MSEVSKRAPASWLHWLDRKGVPRSALVAGTHFRVEDLDDARGRISWEDFALLSARFHALLDGEDELRAVGRSFFDVPAIAPFGRIAGVLVDVRQLKGAGARTIGESLFTPIESKITEQSPGQLVLTVRIREPYADIPSLFFIIRGYLENLPALLARPPAEVTMERGQGRAVYTVSLTARHRRSRVRRFTRYLRAVRSPTLFFDAIAEVQGELRSSLELGRQAAERLATSEARWRAVAEAVGDVIAIVNTDATVQSLSDGITDTPEAFVGRPITGLFHSDDHSVINSVLDAALQRGERQAVTVRSITQREGGPQVLTMDFGPITIDHRVVGVAAVGRDVTVEHRSEEERKNLELRVLHAERFESLGLFAGGIAHDFNNLLTIIRGNAELATCQVSSDSPAQRALSNIDAATARATDLTGQLLAYAGRSSSRLS